MGSSNLELLGQFFVFGFQGLSPSADFLKLIEIQSLGGIILFSRNIESPKQVSGTIRELKSKSKHPLFIMIDQEGGKVNRITKDFPVFPSNKFYGDRRDKEGTFKAYKTTARELARLGISVNLAPVVDVLTNPKNSVIGERSFGEDPILVAEMSKVAIDAIKSENVLACAKHFPGIGDLEIDPHSDLPINLNSRDRFEKIDFLPFKASITCNVDMIMSNHVLCPNLDAREPASLSPLICHDILQKELGFNGISITDDMQMGAIRKNEKLTEACEKAFWAGNDLILIGDRFEDQLEVLGHFEKLVSDEKISEGRLNFSLDKIFLAKKKLKTTMQM
jgi:beta-N-acetylhexosaminidase